ncbi:MAG TPA: uroporphyrinogen-III synthase, partial [Actinomycetota bacterium]|nr:uroporphyrinogen-III synthase [Actinomycetota bacterium]
GASVLRAPAITIESIDGEELDLAIRDVAARGFAWVAFTSPATVEVWSRRAPVLGLGPADLRARVAAVGKATEHALTTWGATVDLVPRVFTTDALGRAFPRGEGRVLLPRADIAPPDLEDTLRQRGWEPVRVDAYRTRPAASLPEEACRALEDGAVDAVTFTSASTVDGFVHAAGALRGPRVACIGPVTARRARERGLPVHAVARPHTAEGLVEAVVRALRGRP